MITGSMASSERYVIVLASSLISLSSSRSRRFDSGEGQKGDFTARKFVTYRLRSSRRNIQLLRKRSCRFLRFLSLLSIEQTHQKHHHKYKTGMGAILSNIYIT